MQAAWPIALALCTVSGWAGEAKISPDLAGLKSRSDVDVIVQYKSTLDAAHHRKISSLGGRLHTSFDGIRAAHYTIPANSLDELENDADVAYVTPDRAVRATAIIAGPISQLDLISKAVDSTNNGRLHGQGIGVAVIDSGIADLADFHSGAFSRIVYQQSFVGGAAADQYGHGTHVAGILAGNGNGGVYAGLAPGVNLINLRVLDQNGQGSDSAVIAAINQAIALRTRYNIQVINLSLGRPVFEEAAKDPLCQAVEAAWKAGIIVVVAAGNEGRNNSAGTQGYGTVTAPGNDPYVITVGAMKTMGTANRADDLIASYSSKGPALFDHTVKPDLVAPGNLIVSTIPAGMTLQQEYPQNQVAPGLFVLSGTSMAAPAVSAAAALLSQQNPLLSADQIKAKLMRTAGKSFPVSSVAVDPVTGVSYVSYYDIFTVGAGYLDIGNALADNTISSGSAASPSAAINNSTGVVTLQGVSGSNTVWGSNVVWGANAVWGSTVVLANNVVWGTNVVWGATGTQGCNVVWGANVVWGNASTAAESSTVSIVGEP